MTTNENKTNAPRNASEVVDTAGRLRLVDFPALASLRLVDGDLYELAHQGFVRQESRGKLVYHKLRFRRENRLVVRYIGDVDQAATICSELARLQADCRLERELARLAKSARRMLRDGKRRLEPIVAAENLRFHGLSLRRPRKDKVAT